MSTLIAEDMLLLLLDDDKGTVAGTSHLQTVLGGAVLIELATTGAVAVEEKTSMWKSAKVRAQPNAVPDDEMLRTAHGIVAEKERSAEDLVNRLGKGAKDELAERLVRRGILERRDDRVLGLFRAPAGQRSTPPTSWPYVVTSRPRSSRTCSPTSRRPA